MSGHTPGEWTTLGEFVVIFRRATEPDKVISMTMNKHVGDDEAAANTQLMSAAPDLLKACEMQQRLIGMLLAEGVPFEEQEDNKFSREAQYAAMDAMMKAKGEEL